MISCQCLGYYIIPVDNYENAPAMRVAHETGMISILDGESLDRIVAKHQPDFIISKIKSIRIERFFDDEIPCSLLTKIKSLLCFVRS